MCIYILYTYTYRYICTVGAHIMAYPFGVMVPCLLTLGSQPCYILCAWKPLYFDGLVFSELISRPCPLVT